LIRIIEKNFNLHDKVNSKRAQLIFEKKKQTSACHIMLELNFNKKKKIQKLTNTEDKRMKTNMMMTDVLD